MINNLSNKFNYQHQKSMSLEELLRMLQRGEAMPSGFRGAPNPNLGNDSSGNAPSPMGQYVPGYPKNSGKYFDGRMPRRMIGGGRRK